MKGANIEGDIISMYQDDQDRGTTITLGRKPDADGKATSTPDASFHFVFKDNINYAFPYFQKAFDVLPHTLELYGNYEYTDALGWHEVAAGNGRFLLGGGEYTLGRIDLHFVGGFTEFGSRETFATDEWLQVSASSVNSVLIDYGATLELSAEHTTNNTGLERIIARTLYVADSFVNNGRLSGESSIWEGGGWVWTERDPGPTRTYMWQWEGGGWIWKEGDSPTRLGNIVYDQQTGWVGQLGGGIWINGGQGTLVNRGTIAPGPNNGDGERDKYVNGVRIPGRRIGTLAIAGNLDMRSQNSAYEVTITDGRYEKATSPGWDMHPYWYTNPVTGVLSLETSDPKSPWNIDPVTGLPLNNDRDIIGGGWAAGASDRLVVSGTTQLGGTLRVYVTPGDYSPNPTTYTIIRSEGGYATGLNFENVEHYIGFLTFEPFGLNASKTYINPYNSKELQFTVIRDADYFQNHGKTYNEISAAKAIDNSLFDSYQVAFSLADNRNTTADLRNMYHQIAGTIRANSLVINLWNPSEVLFPRIGWGNGQMETGNRGRVDWDRIARKKAKVLGQTARCERVGSLWGDILNTSLNAESDGNSDAYSFNRTGFMVGSDWSLTPYSAIGAILSYHNSTLNQVGDKVKSDDYLLGAYFVAAPFNEFEFKAYIGLGCQEYTSERRIYNANIITDRVPLGNGYTDALRGVNDRYTGKTGGNSFNVSLELARPLELHPMFILRPTLGIDVQHVWQSGYTENNISEVPASYGSNIYALRYLRSHYNRDLLRAGFSSESSGPRGGIRMRAFYVSQIAGDQYPIATARFATGGERFTVRGVDMGKGYLHFGVGFNYWLDGERTSSLVFDYDANIYGVSHKVNAHLVSVGLVQNF